MFEKTHRNLTKYYVTVTVTLFTIVIVAFLAVMTWSLYHDEKLEAIAFAKEEAVEFSAIFEKRIMENDHLKMNAVADDSVTKEEIQNSLRMFSILLMPDGQVLPLTFMTKNIEKWTIKQIQERNLEEPQLTTYLVNNEEHHRIFLVKQDIIKDGKVYGAVYAGKDVTIIWTVLGRMFYFSIGLIVFFAIFLFYFGKRAASRAMKPIEQSVLMQKQFITDASHELRTPLTVLMTATQVMKKDSESNYSNFSKKVIDDMQDEINKMSKLVNNLLQLSKLDEQEKNALINEDVVKTAASTVEKLQPLAEKKRINLILENTEEIIWPANNDALAQVLYILIDNAIKYTPEGGDILVFLNILKKDKNYLVVTVEDTGMGIEEREQELIFERFYRVDKARSRQQDGSGLGLSIAKAIVKKQKGNIEVTSTLGKGSLFKVTLPES